MDVPDQRQVYQALKDVLVGANAESWKRKKVKSYIERNRTQHEVRLILEQYDINKVCKVAQALLKDGAFRATQDANAHLSQTVDTSEPSARETIEAGVLNAESGALPNETQNGSQDMASDVEGNPVATLENPLGSAACVPSRISSRRTGRLTSQTISVRRTLVPSLYPIQLTLPTQLRLLKQIQEILEKSLYAFATSKLRNVIRTKGWDYPECVELNIWSNLLLTQQNLIPDRKLSNLRKSWDDILKSVADIRHAAVHRAKLPVSKIIDLLLDAESLLDGLEDDAARLELARLRQNTQETKERIDRNQDLLESRAAVVLRSFTAQKAQIERLERVAIEEVLEDDKAYRLAAGAALDQVISQANVDAVSVCDDERPGALEEYHDAEEFAEDLHSRDQC